MPSSESPASKSPGPRGVLFAILAFALALAAYAPAFEGPFVWDDETLLLRREVAELQPLHSYLSRPFWLSAEIDSGAAYYRPLTILSLALDHALHGNNSTGFHFTNLVLHGFNAVLVLGLGRRLGATLPYALLGALLFAWFPRLSEAAAWVSGRTDLLACFFSLAAVQLTMSATRWRTPLASVLLLLGLLSKEVALAAVPAILVFEWHSRSSQPLRRRFLGLLPTSLACLTYLVLRYRVLGLGFDPGNITGIQRYLTAVEALGRYVAMSADAWHPQLNIGHLGDLDWRFIAFGFVLLPVFVLACLRVRPRSREIPLLVVSAASLALVLHVFPIQTPAAAADRFLYLPIASLAPVIVSRASQLQPIWTAAIAVLTISYLPFTWQRARVWGDDIEFWGTAVQEQKPYLNALSHLGLGNLLQAHGMYGEAAVVFERAQPGDLRNFVLARYSLANLHAMNGETDQALTILEHALSQNNLPRLHIAIARIHAAAGHDQQARRAIARFKQTILDKERERSVDLEHQVDEAMKLRSAMAEPATTLDRRVRRAQHMTKLQLVRAALTELTQLIQDPEMSSSNLQGILAFALDYGTPEQVNTVHSRLLQLDPATPKEFTLLVAEHNDRVERLRALCERLGIETSSGPSP